MTAASAQAERLHRARVEFVEAMAAGCTIIELRQRKADARARLRQRAQQAVIERTGGMVADDAPFQGDFRAFDAAWMMRD